MKGGAVVLPWTYMFAIMLTLEPLHVGLYLLHYAKWSDCQRMTDNPSWTYCTVPSYVSLVEIKRVDLVVVH